MKLFIDDIRMPADVGYVNSDFIIVRSYAEALAMFQRFKFSFVSFDHDLGLAETGMDIAKWLVDYDIQKDCLGPNFKFHVHSANPVGAANINGLLTCYLAEKRKDLPPEYFV